MPTPHRDDSGAPLRYKLTSGWGGGRVDGLYELHDEKVNDRPCWRRRRGTDATGVYYKDGQWVVGYWDEMKEGTCFFIGRGGLQLPHKVPNWLAVDQDTGDWSPINITVRKVRADGLKTQSERPPSHHFVPFKYTGDYLATGYLISGPRRLRHTPNEDAPYEGPPLREGAELFLMEANREFTRVKAKDEKAEGYLKTKYVNVVEEAVFEREVVVGEERRPWRVSNEEGKMPGKGMVGSKKERAVRFEGLGENFSTVEEMSTEKQSPPAEGDILLISAGIQSISGEYHRLPTHPTPTWQQQTPTTTHALTSTPDGFWVITLATHITSHNPPGIVSTTSPHRSRPPHDVATWASATRHGWLPDTRISVSTLTTSKRSNVSPMPERSVGAPLIVTNTKLSSQRVEGKNGFARSYYGSAGYKESDYERVE